MSFGDKLISRWVSAIDKSRSVAKVDRRYVFRRLRVLKSLSLLMQYSDWYCGKDSQQFPYVWLNEELQQFLSNSNVFIGSLTCFLLFSAHLTKARSQQDSIN